ncbi:aminotransferase class III-fold pyridoxal phosphate-dependent enzyme [Actinophytocola sp. NPDC049390]|uniref:aminotransferase class III-fold pyridoxal phosphate-dependent enzyme n=1 Tax=Actinophytocola sp. NPDC049390 TaxID=3363894 RepID=UPI003793C487
MEPTDGLPFVPDFRASHGPFLVDQGSGEEYLSLHTCPGAAVLGVNPPELVDDTEFLTQLAQARHEPTGTEADRRQRAEFADTFARVLGDPRLPYREFVDDGVQAVARAVEYATAWKRGHNAAHGRRAPGNRVLALRPPGAGPEHGPAFERAALEHTRRAFAAHGDDIACLVAEPILAGPGDHHVRAGFLQAAQRLCHDNDALLVLDEVRTGVGLTGTPWAYQQLGLAPDVVAFGDRLRLGGVMAGHRAAPATELGVAGALADLVHARRVLEVVETRDLCGRARRLGRVLVAMLGRLTVRFPDHVSHVRGRGLMCGFDLSSTEVRDEMVAGLREYERVLVRPAGPRSIGLRAPLTVTLEELEAGVFAMHRVLAGLERRSVRAA